MQKCFSQIVHVLLLLEGTRPSISSLYLLYSIIEGSKLAQAASGDYHSKDATVVISHVQNASCSICIMC